MTTAKKKTTTKRRSSGGNGSPKESAGPSVMGTVVKDPIELTDSELEELQGKSNELDQMLLLLGKLDLDAMQLDKQRQLVKSQQERVRQEFFDRKKAVNERVQGLVAGRGIDPKSADWHVDFPSRTISPKV